MPSTAATTAAPIMACVAGMFYCPESGFASVGERCAPPAGCSDCPKGVRTHAALLRQRATVVPLVHPDHVHVPA
jgi:hypothetical protein